MQCPYKCPVARVYQRHAFHPVELPAWPAASHIPDVRTYLTSATLTGGLALDK